MTDRHKRSLGTEVAATRAVEVTFAAGIAATRGVEVTFAAGIAALVSLGRAALAAGIAALVSLGRAALVVGIAAPGRGRVSRVARIAAVGPVALAMLLLAGAATAADAPSQAPARPAGLVVALSLGDSGLQAGVVRGREVILARGFEVELARILARRLGTRVAGFVNVGSPGRLLAAGAPGWHLALASIEASTARPAARFSIPYVTTDLAVVLRRGLERPARLADLRKDVICVVKGSGAHAVATRSIHPARVVRVAPGAERLRAMLRAGVCDAGVVPAVEAGRLLAGQHRLVGPVAGRIRHGKGLVVAVARDGGLDVARVDRELRRLRADGTLGRLARTWLGLDPAALRRLP